mmetsp:Transcript_14415/g.36549  ORF Transcript_14415/g.36549 Transcript_14415/m.36549 type:complete len:226 (+) Transcript_14415:476-1153(+)
MRSTRNRRATARSRLRVTHLGAHEYFLPRQPRRHLFSGGRPLRADRGDRRIRQRSIVCALRGSGRGRKVGLQPCVGGLPVPSAVLCRLQLSQHGCDRLRLERGAAFWHHLYRGPAMGPRFCPSRCGGGVGWPQLGAKSAFRTALQVEQDSARNPTHAVVPSIRVPSVHGRVSPILCNLHRASLHLRLGVGPQALHALRGAGHRHRDAGRSHLLHHDSTYLLPIGD